MDLDATQQNGCKVGTVAKGTGVFFPPALTSKLQRNKPATKNAADSSPAGTPTSCSRSGSFSSTSSASAGGAPLVVQPLHYSAAAQPSARGCRQPQQAATAGRLPSDAGIMQLVKVKPAQPAYGRFSLDHSFSQPAVASQDRPCSAQLAGQSMQCSAAAGSWPASNSLCNSLSAPCTPSPFSTAVCSTPCGMVVQDEASWSSTASGHNFLLSAGDAAALASAQLAQQHNREQQDQLLAQHQQQQDQLQRVQHHQKCQLLLSQLGSPDSFVAGCQQLHVHGCSVDDSALLANLAYAGPCARSAAPRRASICSYVQVPSQGVQANGRACSVPTLGMQLQQLAAVRRPLPTVSPTADVLADAYDNALEAELDAALQQLLVMRSEVELKKVRASQASAACTSLAGMPSGSTRRTSLGGMVDGSAPSTMLAAMPAAGAPNSMLVAAAMSPTLYQPSNATAAAATAAALVHTPNSNLYAAAQVAAVPDASACMPLTNPYVSLGGFASGAGNCMQDSFSASGQAMGGDATMADWLGCKGASAGVPAQQVTLQVDGLELLALHQAGMTGRGAGQHGPISHAQLAALAQSMQGPFVL